MSTGFDNSNRVTLNQNKKADPSKPLSPTHWGNGNVGNVEVIISGWRKQDNSIELKIRCKEEGGPVGKGVLRRTERKDKNGNNIYEGEAEFDGSTYKLVGFRNKGVSQKSGKPYDFMSVQFKPEAADAPQSGGETPENQEAPF